jgi:hypothetical protein
MATVEAAHLQVQAARRPDLKGVASGVGRLTQAVFDQVPGAHSLSLWRELERLDGPTPISIPAAVEVVPVLVEVEVAVPRLTPALR